MNTKKSGEQNKIDINLLDYFAGQALMGAVSSDECVKLSGQQGKLEGKKDTEMIAILSYKYAKAMLKEREKYAK